MLTKDQTARLLRNPTALIMFDGFDAFSKTLQGPYPCIGDCVSEQQQLAAAYVDTLNVRDGDLGIWFMPSRERGEQYACKWLVADSAGRSWLACKYFAVRYRADYHRAVGRVVAIIRGEAGTFDEPLAQRLSEEMAALRASPPQRDDVIVFTSDLLDHEAIVAELDRRHQMA